MSVIVPAITPLAVLTAAYSAIRNDAATVSYCQTQWKKALKIFVGLDKINPPKEEDAPFLVLTPSPSPYDMGQAPADDRRNFSFECYWGILEKGKTESDSQTTITQDGLTKSDALGQLILNALYQQFPDTLFSAQYLLYPEEPPLFEGAMSCTITQFIGLDQEPVLNG
jgi:hypothetical protein